MQNAQFRVINPIIAYEINGETCKVICVPSGLTVGANRLIYAAVTGKKIRVMGYDAQSAAATYSAFAFRSASGGTYLTAFKAAPPNTNGDSFFKPITNSGYFETNTGEGLYIDIGTNDLNLETYLIVYTP